MLFVGIRSWGLEIGGSGCRCRCRICCGLVGRGGKLGCCVGPWVAVLKGRACDGRVVGLPLELGLSRQCYCVAGVMAAEVEVEAVGHHHRLVCSRTRML
jgi:hypothetical protein